jgi:hypothetical protein
MYVRGHVLADVGSNYAASVALKLVKMVIHCVWVATSGMSTHDMAGYARLIVLDLDAGKHISMLLAWRPLPRGGLDLHPGAHFLHFSAALQRVLRTWSSLAIYPRLPVSRLEDGFGVSFLAWLEVLLLQRKDRFFWLCDWRAPAAQEAKKKEKRGVEHGKDHTIVRLIGIQSAPG